MLNDVSPKLGFTSFTSMCDNDSIVAVAKTPSSKQVNVRGIVHSLLYKEITIETDIRHH
jgi:hypothetical protein